MKCPVQRLWQRITVLRTSFSYEKNEVKPRPAAGEVNRQVWLFSAAGRPGIFSRHWAPRSGCTKVPDAAASSACLAWLGRRP